jgi:hypothetical protein
MKLVSRFKKDKAFRFRLEKWFWVAMIIPTIFWWGDYTIYVSLLSVYALVLSAGGKEQAAEATQAAKDSNRGGGGSAT